MDEFETQCNEAIAGLDQMGVEIQRIRHRINWVEQELDREEELERQRAAMPKFTLWDMVTTRIKRTA